MRNAAIHHVTAIRRLHAEQALRSFGVVLEVESGEAAAKVLNDAFGLTSARRDHDRTVLLPRRQVSPHRDRGRAAATA